MREMLAGFALTFPLAAAGLAMIYLPDYLGNHRHNDTPGFSNFLWGSLFGVSFLIAAFVGLRRSFKTVSWDFDPQSGMLQHHGRVMLGWRTFVEWEIPMAEVKVLGGAESGKVELCTSAGLRQSVASAYLGKDELRAIKEAIDSALEADRIA